MNGYPCKLRVQMCDTIDFHEIKLCIICFYQLLSCSKSNSYTLHFKQSYIAVSINTKSSRD